MSQQNQTAAAAADADADADPSCRSSLQQSYTHPANASALSIVLTSAAGADSMRDGDPTAAECASTPSAAMDGASGAAADEPEPQTEALSHAQAHATSQPMSGSKSGQIDEMVAAMAAVPAHPPAAFVQSQSVLVRRLMELLGCASDFAGWSRAASMLTAEQALAIFQVAMRVESADADADRLVSRVAASNGRSRGDGQKVHSRCLPDARTMF